MATWSMQKNRNLTKPMMIVTTDGYIVDVQGLYDGKSSDADIMLRIMNEPDTKPWFDATFREGDIFVLDRGFKNAVQALTERGFVVKIPSFLHTKQFSDEEANQSRMCTMIRWVVEARNHTLKLYKYFDHVVNNKNLPHLFEDVKIGCALVNAFEKPFLL